MRSKDDLRRGIVLPDPRAVARKLRIRRIKRQIKAALSLAIAAVAGTYIACDAGEKRRPNVPPNPTTDEIPNLPAPRDAGADSAIDAATDAAADAPIDAAPHALVRRDAAPDAKVDRTEHRKGMPVPDNLLE